MIPPDVLADLATLGLSGDQARAVAEMLHRVEVASEDKGGRAIEARRAADRARKQKERGHVTSRDVTGRSVTSQDDPSPKESSPTPPKEITPSQPLASLGIQRAREAFDRLVRIYPKRAGSDPRKIAWQRFERLVKAGVDPDAIVAGAAAYAAYMADDDPQFIKQLAVWLNAEGWLEDWANKPRRGSSRAPPRSSNGFGVIADEMAERVNGRSGGNSGERNGGRCAEPGFFDPAGPADKQAGAGFGGPILDLVARRAD